jgi:predicted Fe-Mo cluster-binding NifX family protein
MAMMIAIPHWQNRVSPVFDVSKHLFLITVQDGKETARKKLVLTSADFWHRAKALSHCGVRIVICGAISYSLETVLLSAGIQVIGFVCGRMEDVTQAFLHGRLDEQGFRMPGCGHRFQVSQFQGF